jgi:ankyrin repeat protein
VDPFLAQNLHLPFLGVRFVGEPSEPILEEDADNIKDDEVKEPLVKERGHVVAFVENDPEPEVNTESSASVQSTSQKTTTVSNEPSGATELDPVVEVATAMASGPGEVLPCSEVPMTEATSVLDDSTKSSPLNSGPQVSSAKLATPPDPLETPRSEIGSEPTQEQRLSAELRSPSTSEHSIYRVSSDHRFRKSTVSANAEIDPHISDKGKYEGIGTFSINFGPSPTLDIADLQPINQTGTERSPQTELPDIKIDDMDNTSISHRSSDGNSPDRPIPAGMPAPKRPPPPIPIVVPDFEVAAGLGSSDHSMGMQSPRALRSVGEGDIEARTTSSNQSSESSLRSLSRDSAASTPYTSIPSTARSQSSTLPASSLTQVGATVRATQAGEAGVKPRASRQFSKEMIIKSVSALQRNHLSETTSNTSKPRKLSKRPLMALLSIGGRSKQTEKSSAVYAAAATGNSEYLLQLLEANPKLINTTTSQICASGLVQPRTPLMCATIGGHLDCVDILRSFGADTGMSDKQGKTALHLAVEAGQLGAVTRLLQPVFDGEAGGPRPRSTNGSTNGVAELDGSNPLPRTTERRVPIIKRASTEARASLEATDHLGRTPLHYAVIERKEAIVAALVANGAVVDALDANKETPLIWAVKRNDANSMFTLTAAGANTKHRDIKGDSLLSHAARLGRLNILEMMATQQADLELKNLSGERPLHVACLNDRSTVVYTLLQKRVEVNSWTEPPASKPNMYFPRPACGQRRAPSLSLPATSLHLACLHGFFDVGAILLKHGAWVNAALEDTRTPLMLAVDSGNAQLVSLLLENGAKVNAATSKECLTALHLSCRNGDLEITRMLVSYGANTFALTRGGSLETPPRHALSCHNGNIPLNQRAAVNYVQEINQAHARQTGRLIVGPSRLPGNEESYASGYGLTPSNDGFPAGSQQPPPPYSQSPSTAASKTQFR